MTSGVNCASTNPCSEALDLINLRAEGPEAILALEHGQVANHYKVLGYGYSLASQLVHRQFKLVGRCVVSLYLLDRVITSRNGPEKPAIQA